MAVFGLVVALSNIFLLLLNGAAAATDDNAVYCRVGGSGGCDEATATALIDDLKAILPSLPRQRYCNVLTMSGGEQMFGYGYCSTIGRSLNPTAACLNCLDYAGEDLVSECQSTGGAGEVWGPVTLCYIRVGPDNCASMVKVP